MKPSDLLAKFNNAARVIESPSLPPPTEGEIARLLNGVQVWMDKRYEAGY